MATTNSNSQTKSRPRLRGIQEALFAVNFTGALCYGLAIYMIQSGLSFPPTNDADYFFLCGVVRFADLMHLGATTAVSTNAVARGEMPVIMNKLAIESTFLVSLCSLYFVTLLLLRLGRRLVDEEALRLLSGAVAVFAAPGFCLLAAHLPSDISPDPGSGFLTRVLCGEIFGFLVLAAWARRRSISVWTVGILLLLHFGFWSLIVLGTIPWREFRESFGPLFYFCFLFWLVPSAIAACLAFLSLGRYDLSTTHREGRIGKWTMIAGTIGSVVLLAIWLPARGYSLTKAKDFRTAVIELSRGPCYGMCPSYTVTIHGDGSVEYVGGRFARHDAQTANIGTEAVTQILRQLDDVHFSALEDRAFSWCFDSSSVSVSVSLDGRTKHVVSDAGCTGAKSGLQSRFVQVADNIDRIVDSERWIRCVGGPCRQ